MNAPPAPNLGFVGSDDLRSALDERLLVEQARRDPEAFTLLYRAYVARIHGFAYRRTGSYETAEEVTAATFERAFRGLPGFAWKGGGFEPWLFRIASNELVSHYRRTSRASNDRMQRVLWEMAEELREDEALTAVLEADERDARLGALRRALATLRPRYQEVIGLRYLAGLTPEEAAAAVGCTKATLAVTLHRAIKALRAAIQHEIANGARL